MKWADIGEVDRAVLVVFQLRVLVPKVGKYLMQDRIRRQAIIDTEIGHKTPD